MLDYGLFRVHENGRVIGISGFLVQTDQGENAVIDAGFPPKYAADAKAASQEDRLGAFGEVLELSPRNLPAAQLALTGVREEDVGLFILSHTHIDHLGGLDLFPEAPIALSAAERALPKPLYWGAVQPLPWPDRDYRLIHGDTRIGPGFEILFAPGHAPGQLAFLLDLPQTGAVLITSDAISRPAELAEGFSGAHDPALARFHAERLMRLAAERNALVIYGHSPEQWPTLRKAPSFYG
ncbi:MAG TPA: MBL fold metallo-hydrolase [Mesorhizobium sp.]|nr:MBL fold metallo-hydrolase [Mesorhizobium sp.]